MIQDSTVKRAGVWGFQPAAQNEHKFSEACALERGCHTVVALKGARLR
jgi:hypothetical protein